MSSHGPPIDRLNHSNHHEDIWDILNARFEHNIAGPGVAGGHQELNILQSLPPHDPHHQHDQYFFLTQQQEQLATPLLSIVDQIAADEGYSLNTKGGGYEKGKGFSKEKWLNIMKAYECLLAESNHNPVSANKLAKAAKINHQSAQKAIVFYVSGKIEQTPQGHGYHGIGSIKGKSSNYSFHTCNVLFQYSKY